jgi:hypothetical protein
LFSPAALLRRYGPTSLTRVALSPPTELKPLVVPSRDGEYLVWEDYPFIGTNVRAPSAWCITRPDGSVSKLNARGLSEQALRDWLAVAVGAEKAVQLVVQLNLHVYAGVLASPFTRERPFVRRLNGSH